jgi:hypothetical protein
MAVIETGY